MVLDGSIYDIESLVLIAPLWNWNTSQIPSEFWLFWSSNRTFMELKYLLKLRMICQRRVLIAPLWNWNRNSSGQHSCQTQVLIAPLWNWNECFVCCSAWYVCSNRTFMELKLGDRCLIVTATVVLIAPLWNWNLQSPNCHNFQIYVLIAPLWNWNYNAEER